jgi:hypothetical protein
MLPKCTNARSCWHQSDHSSFFLAAAMALSIQRMRKPILRRNTERLQRTLLWSAFQGLANREQEHGTFVFRVRRKEVGHVIVEEGQPGRAQALGISS